MMDMPRASFRERIRRHFHWGLFEIHFTHFVVTTLLAGILIWRFENGSARTDSSAISSSNSSQPEGIAFIDAYYTAVSSVCA